MDRMSEGQVYKTLNEQDKKIFREWLKHHLEYGPTLVTFIKKDGTVREMNCTTKLELVKLYEKKTDRKINDEVCFAFDLVKQEWRSFRYDTITSIKFL